MTSLPSFFSKKHLRMKSRLRDRVWSIWLDSCLLLLLPSNLNVTKSKVEVSVLPRPGASVLMGGNGERELSILRLKSLKRGERREQCWLFFGAICHQRNESVERERRGKTKRKKQNRRQFFFQTGVFKFFHPNLDRQTDRQEKRVCPSNFAPFFSVCLRRWIIQKRQGPNFFWGGKGKGRTFDSQSQQGDSSFFFILDDGFAIGQSIFCNDCQLLLQLQERALFSTSTCCCCWGKKCSSWQGWELVFSILNWQESKQASKKKLEIKNFFHLHILRESEVVRSLRKTFSNLNIALSLSPHQGCQLYTLY